MTTSEQEHGMAPQQKPEDRDETNKWEDDKAGHDEQAHEDPVESGVWEQDKDGEPR